MIEGSSTRLAIVKKETTKAVFLENLSTKMPEFLRHNFIYWWEDREFKRFMMVFPQDVILLVINYEENYMMALIEKNPGSSFDQHTSGHFGPCCVLPFTCKHIC